MTERNAATPLAKVWQKLDPAHYYEAGEIAILRAYFGLKPRRGDPALAELYEAPDETVDRNDWDTPSGGWELRGFCPPVDGWSWPGRETLKCRRAHGGSWMSTWRTANSIVESLWNTSTGASRWRATPMDNTPQAAGNYPSIR